MLFEEYLQSNMAWGGSNLVLAMKRTLTSARVGQMRWMTEDDLMIRYHNKAAVVQAVIVEKRKAGEVKPHPDTATVELFHCWDTEYTTHTEAVEETSELSMSVGYDNDLYKAFLSDCASVACKGQAPKPKPAPKPKVELSPEEEKHETTKKLHKQLVTQTHTLNHLLATVESSDVLASAMRDTLTKDLQTAARDVEAR